MGSLEIEDVFNFPSGLAVDLDILRFWLLSFYSQVWLMITKNRFVTHWVYTFHGKRQFQFVHRHQCMLTKRKGPHPSVIQFSTWMCCSHVLAVPLDLLAHFPLRCVVDALPNFCFIESSDAWRYSVILHCTSLVCFSQWLTSGMHCLDNGVLL